MKKFALACYGVLGLPLAMSALPIYVQIPAYYTKQLGLPLAATGIVLFLARLFDTLQDPLLGRMIDRRQRRIGSWLWLGALLLALGFAGLWLPIFGASLWWLAAMLCLAYSAHSMLNIAYLAWGARLAEQGEAGLLGGAAWREGWGLLGVISASIIPLWLLQGSPAQVQQQLTWYALVFAVLLLLALVLLLRFAPSWQHTSQESAQDWRATLAQTGFRRLLPIYFINALASAIPATLTLFYIADRLEAGALGPYFLATYFLAGSCGLPLWVMLAKRWGAAKAWQLSMLLAIVSFVGACFLGRGDIVPYFLICFASGLALGADLALPPVLLAEVIPPQHACASYYGIWTLLGKLALAVAGLSLPLLAMLGYQPGVLAHTESLLLLYGFVPCIAKLLAFILLHRYAKSS